MIPATRWRRAAGGAVVAADLVLVLLGGAVLPGFVPYAVVLLAGATFWGLLRPGGWGGFALVLAQVLAIGVPRGVPATVGEWGVAVVSATAILLTHLALALLAAWPAGAALPRETAARWLRQGGGLVLTAVGAGALGVAGTSTPVAWGPWLLAVALVLLAAVGATLWAGAARRRA
jgi:hypothetical protein